MEIVGKFTDIRDPEEDGKKIVVEDRIGRKEKVIDWAQEHYKLLGNKRNLKNGILGL